MVQKISQNADGELRLEDDVETTELKLTQLKANFGKNLLQNPQFDSYDIDTNLPDFWTLVITPTLAIVPDTLFPARKGNQVTMTATGVINEGMKIQATTPMLDNWLQVLPETKYTFAFDYKCNAGDELFIIITSFNGAAQGSSHVQATLASDTAIRVPYTFITDADADNLEIWIVAKNDGDIVTISHPKLEEGAIATPYIPLDRDRKTTRTEATNTTPDPHIASRSNQHIITALAAPPTISVPTGLVYDGDKLRFRFEDNGTGRAITWNAIFEAVAPLPASTTASKKLYVDFAYNAADVKFDCVYSVEEP